MDGVVVAGGGIGGLSAALALARAGLPVTLLERAPAFGEVGAGLQLGPNAMRVLAGLGVAEAVAARGFRPVAATVRLGLSGREVFRMALGPAAVARWGAPYVQIHRADLVDILRAAAEAAGARLVPGQAVAGFRGGAGLRVETAGGGEIAACALVGADGLLSATRTALFGPEAARFTGNVAWRATVPAARVPAGLAAPEATLWAGPGAHLVTYWLRGGSLLNLVAVTERADWTGEGWSEPGDPAALRAAFAGWHPAVTGLLAAVETCFLWALRDRAPLPRWGRGRVTLLGDACHPMLPFLAQGAAMAIEDAAVLARCLGAPGVETEAALARYEGLRRARTARVQRGARANARLFHLRHPLARAAAWAPAAAASRLAPGLAAGRFDWLYRFDAGAG